MTLKEIIYICLPPFKAKNQTPGTALSKRLAKGLKAERDLVDKLGEQKEAALQLKQDQQRTTPSTPLLTQRPQALIPLLPLFIRPDPGRESPPGYEELKLPQCSQNIFNFSTVPTLDMKEKGAGLGPPIPAWEI